MTQEMDDEWFNQVSQVLSLMPANHQEVAPTLKPSGIPLAEITFIFLPHSIRYCFEIRTLIPTISSALLNS